MVARRWREKSQHKLGIWRKPLILCQGFGRQVLGLFPASDLCSVPERRREREEGGKKTGERESGGWGGVGGVGGREEREKEVGGRERKGSGETQMEWDKEGKRETETI